MKPAVSATKPAPKIRFQRIVKCVSTGERTEELASMHVPELLGAVERIDAHVNLVGAGMHEDAEVEGFEQGVVIGCVRECDETVGDG